MIEFLVIVFGPYAFMGTLIGIGLLLEWRRCRRLGRPMFFDAHGARKG
jgi:hypothetical protein